MINNINLAKCITRGLTNARPNQDGSSSNSIFKIKLGNGGAISSNGITLFQPPNVNTENGTLYNELISILTDEGYSSTPNTNSVIFTNVAGKLIITISALVPVGQEYTFSELGLFTSNDELIAHAVFSPITKSANEAFPINYSLTVTVI